MVSLDEICDNKLQEHYLQESTLIRIFLIDGT